VRSRMVQLLALQVVLAPPECCGSLSRIERARAPTYCVRCPSPKPFLVEGAIVAGSFCRPHSSDRISGIISRRRNVRRTGRNDALSSGPVGGRNSGVVLGGIAFVLKGSAHRLLRAAAIKALSCRGFFHAGRSSTPDETSTPPVPPRPPPPTHPPAPTPPPPSPPPPPIAPGGGPARAIASPTFWGRARPIA